MLRVTGVFVVAAALCVAAMSAHAIEVKKTLDPELRYSVEIGHDCHVAISPIAAQNVIVLYRGGACSPDVADETPAIAAILDAMTRNGAKLKEFKTLALGRIGEPLWQRRIAECYVARNGMSDRKPRKFDIGSCNIFREVNALFMAHGVALHFEDGTEESEYLDLRSKKDRAYALKLEPQWAEKLNKSRGLILTSTIVYLHIVPLSTMH